MSDQIKYLLDESRMPKAWYNIAADLPVPLPPPLHPGTLQPLGPSDLAPLFPNAIIAQEMSTERYIDIPEPVRDVLRQWRPSPLFRARRLEKLLGTPAKIYYKYEGVSPAGSHKPNSAVPQAWYNAQEGVKRLTTETGAGQWGSSLAYAGGLYGLDVTVFQVRVSYDQKPYRRALMETWGARCIPSPSPETEYGRAVLAKHPDHIGSLGIAISEAVEVAAQHDDTKYALGSVLNHVLLHQTIIGEEAILQMEMAGDDPDVVISCVGGGSNFAGIAFPFIGLGLRGGPNAKKRRILAVTDGAVGLGDDEHRRQGHLAQRRIGEVVGETGEARLLEQEDPLLLGLGDHVTAAVEEDLDQGFPIDTHHRGGVVVVDPVDFPVVQPAVGEHGHGDQAGDRRRAVGGVRTHGSETCSMMSKPG